MTDVSLSEKFDVILRTMDWQKQALTTKTPQLKSVRENLYVEKKKKSKDKELKKDHKKHKKNSKGRITLKLKKSLFTGEQTKDGEFKRKKSSSQEPLWSTVPLSSDVLSSVPAKKVRLEEDDDSSSVYGSSLHSSPSASPAPIDRSSLKRHSTSNHKNKQTMSSKSYDIDNIVIPHSMAASTRVEKLEYKEIQTPKWRILPHLPNNVHHSSKCASHEDEMDEDVSEEAVIARHGRSEELERKKFLQYLHMQVTTRSSRSRRTDSSGTNTPDHPLSPRLPDPASDTISPLATPPTTPLAPSEDSNQSSSLPTVTSIQSSSCSTSGATGSTFTTVATQAGLSTTSHPSQQQHQQQQQHQPSQLIIHNNSQISSNSILTHLPASAPISAASSIATSVSSLTSSTPLSISTLSSFLHGTRRHRTFSSSSATKSKVSAGFEEGISERLEGIIPYEQRVFPLNEAELTMITQETEDCDIGPPSPPFDTSANDANNCEESGRSTPMSEVTDSAPEEDEEFDDSAAPKWTISGLKDATGQCVLQIHRN